MPWKDNFFSNRRQIDPFANVDFMPRQQQAQMPSYDSPDIEPYDPNSGALAAYEEYIKRMPTRQQYAPTLPRKILAAVAGGAEGYRGGPARGITTAEGINQIPFRQATEDWGMEGEALKSRANIETTRNNQELNYYRAQYSNYNQGANRGLRQQSIDVQKHDSETKAKLAELTEQRNNARTVAEQKRLDATISNWTATRANERKNIELRERQISAYEDRTGAISNKLPSFGELNSQRNLAEQEIKNMHAEWLTPDGYIKPENLAEFETEVQNKIRARRGNINLPPDNSDWELLK